MNEITAENDPTRCWYLTGATAVGKTAVALELASRLGAEVLSLDSMAVYRGMDIGTAKPSPEQQRQVPHHLIDVVDPSDDFSVAQYRSLALAKIVEVRGRGKEVLFVGGTPLYLKIMLRGMFDGPAADPALRAEIEAQLEQIGTPAAHARLAAIDPVAASAIHPNDARRIIRALEVFHATGQPISHQQFEFEEGAPAEQRRVFVLRRERADQHRRIEERVEAMLAAGLVEEARGLTSKGRTLGPTASQAVGYREAFDFIAGAISEAEMTARIQARTRRFAKRQGTWFRGLSECRFVDVGETDAKQQAERIMVDGA
ncbi:IPP transferase [Pirellulimonas nuda]|uniref:tRNA dimethylallyltransferase n=1 Tax=Pirellulimonas nuda TaxID=2528009 RepID=A0A518DGH2_9BACT|nr:tRNA (adenosine(37)-N6)-dimethylallyltransferase MiaA [Pirellulimonas nuda]QDU90577.1 IPP transferase [Pirellulimonas nuda]